MSEILTLLVIFQLKHLIADYFLQGKYMLGKFKQQGWEMPLLAHSFVHFGLTLFILLMFGSLEMALMLALVDMVVHFSVDRCKVLSSRKYDSKKDKEFWWLLGIDQMFHHFTHYFIIWSVITWQ